MLSKLINSFLFPLLIFNVAIFLSEMHSHHLIAVYTENIVMILFSYNYINFIQKEALP